MAGEVGEDMLSLLIPQPDYRKKILQRLLLENKIVRYQKDGVKGYRLTISGKRWMLQSDYNRFSYFLANGADASMRRSDLIHRKRQHRLAEMMALFSWLVPICSEMISRISFRNSQRRQSSRSLFSTVPENGKTWAAFLRKSSVPVEQVFGLQKTQSGFATIWME